MNQDVRTIPFVKASACGNDFLLIDFALAPAAAELSSFTRRICHRNSGVGADGIEWMLPHPTADVEIRLINADGSEAEISGNGTRCVAAYLSAEHAKEKITLQTGAGLKTCILTEHNDSEYEFETSMGPPVVEEELVVTTESSVFRGLPVSMGNPHYVVFVSKLPDDWQLLAAGIQRCPQFQHGVNVEFVSVIDQHTIDALFFERGVGATTSSGTGSCACAAAAMATGRATSPVKVQAPGGVQTVREKSGEIFLRGPARLICRGDFFLS